MKTRIGNFVKNFVIGLVMVAAIIMTILGIWAIYNYGSISNPTY